MATAPVDIAVRVRGENEVNKLVRTMGVLEREVGQLNRKLPKAANNISKVGRASQQSAGKVNKLAKGFNGLQRAIAGLAIGAGIKKAFGDASALESAETRINSLVKSYSKFSGVQDIAAKSAEKFRLTQTEALAAYADLGSRLGGTSTSLTDLANIYDGFNTLLINNKVEAQQAAAAQLQLGQALGEGVLRAEEYNSLIATTPQLLDEVARVLKVPRAGLKKLAGEGKISSEALIQALANIKTKGADQLEASLAGAFGASKDFNKAATELSTTIGTELLPAIIPLLKAATELLKAFGDLPGPVKTLTVAVTGLTAAAVLLAPGLGAVGAALVAIKGLLTTQAALMAAFGVKIYATSAAVGVLTKAMALLKAAMLALPWVALAAGIAYVAKGAIDARGKIAALETKLRDTTGTGEALKQKMNETAAEIERLKGQVDKAGPSADYVRKKIELLTASLNAMKGRYDIEIVLSTYGVDVGSLEDGFYGPGGVAPKPKPKPTVTVPSGGGGGGAAPRESELPALKRQVELSNQLLENDRQRLEAQYQGNTEQLKQLSLDRVQIEFAGKQAEIEAEKISELEKQEKLKLAEIERSLAIYEIDNASLELAKQKQETLKGVLLPIQDEIKLLQGKLNGNEKEIKQLIEIRDLKEQIANAGGDPGIADGLVKQRDALAEQAEAADKLKSQYKILASGIAGEFTSAFRSIIDGSKTAEEALADMFQGIADKFLDMAMQILQDQITQQLVKLFSALLGGGGNVFGGNYSGMRDSFDLSPGQFGAFAEGGRPKQNQVSIVGERGPELFVPDSAGTVLSNSQSRDAMSRYSPATGGANGGGSGTYKLETVVINNVEYATVDQVRQMGKASAKEGAAAGNAMTMNSLRNSRSQRNKIGLR